MNNTAVLPGFEALVSASLKPAKGIIWAPPKSGKLTACNALCVSATGKKCDCACRGHNHGGQWR